MQYSAGIIPFRINGDNELEFFVGHPGGAYQHGKDIWLFMKGGVEDGETWTSAAMREFKEETGLAMEDCAPEMLIPLGLINQSIHKKVFAYGLHYPDIDPSKCESNLCEDGVTREVDQYRWMTYGELKGITHPAHLAFYEQLLEMHEDSKRNQQ